MQLVNKKILERKTQIVYFITIFSVFCIIKTYNYLLFHTLVEFIGVFITLGVFVISINSSYIHKNSYLTFLSIGFFFFGMWDLIHALFYQAMHIFQHTSSNLSTQLRLIAIYIEAISISMSFIFINKDVKAKKVFLTYLILSIILFVAVYYLKIFPICYIDGYGLTWFKKIAEFFCCVLLLINTYILKKNKNEFDDEIYKYILRFLFFLIFSEVAFTCYVNLYGNLNFAAHILKIIAQYYVFNIFIKISFMDPYKLLFRKIESTNNVLTDQKLKLQDLNRTLAVKEERYKKLIDILPCGIIECRKEIIIDMNLSAANILKVKSRKEIIGINAIDLIQTSISNITKDFGSNETKIKCLDGSIIDVSMIATKFEFGEELIDLIVLADISKVKQNELLNLKIKEKEKEENLKNEFFSNVSHEFRTPVNILVSSVQMLEMFNEQAESNKYKEKNKKYLKMMKQNCNRLMRLINNMLDITKIDSQYYNINKRNCNIIDIVERITMSTKSYIENKNLKLEFTKNTDNKILFCDPDIIERVLLNLISNAIKFSRQNGIIKVTICDEGDSTSISVRDNGIGIPEEKMDEIFLRFKQVENTFTRRNEGTGIGLSLVKAFVEMHDGDIKVISKEGQGCEFIIKLPNNICTEKCDEVNQKNEKISNITDNVERVNIEFSDIYF